MKGGPSDGIQKNLEKKSHSAEKSGAKVGSLDVCFVFSFRFGRASEVGVVGG